MIWHPLPLGRGLELRCAMDSLDDSVLVEVRWRGIRLNRQRFRRGNEHNTWKLSLPLVLQGRLGLWVDMFAGEIVGEGEIAVRPFVGGWHQIVDVPRDVLVSFDPAIGEIGGSAAVTEPVVDDPRYGRSQLCTPAILRMHVDDGERAISDAGRLVKQTLFPDHPPFLFNTIACVGPPDEKGLGAYPDPNSIWFNTFFGCYEIVAAKKDWSRPFGYESAAGAESAIAFDDIARLGKADWNFFSNWMYGVPVGAIEPYDAIGALENTQSPEPERIGRTLWHSAVVDGLECVSTYESTAEGAARLVTNSLIDDVWRRAFGLPNPQPDRTESFVPTALRAEFLMAYSEDEEAYRTLIGGGTATIPVDEEFLAAQMAAMRRTIEQAYADSGFQPAA